MISRWMECEVLSSESIIVSIVPGVFLLPTPLAPMNEVVIQTVYRYIPQTTWCWVFMVLGRVSVEE